jgi:hypothetical protein
MVPAMFQFPPHSKLAAFRGDAITQVWLDPFGVRFIFEGQRQIYAERSALYVEANGTEWPFECMSGDARPVMFHRLLQKQVVLVEREEFRLTLRMDDGSALVIGSELGLHESGHIIMNDADFMVF